MGFLSVFATAALFLFGQVSSFYPCPQPPAVEHEHVMSLQEAYSHHLQYAQGWYYVVGTACESGSEFEERTCESPLAYQVIVYMYNVSQTGVNQIVSPGVVGVTDKSGHYQWSGTGKPVEFPDPQVPFDLNFNASSAGVYAKFENVGFLPTGVTGSSYKITVSSPNVTMDLYLLSLTPTMWQGNGGYAGFPNSTTCTGYYYVSMPQLFTFGTMNYNGRQLFISGESWLDHEWGGVLPGSGGAGAGKNGWVWIGVRFGSTSIMAIILRQNNVYLFGENSTLNIQLGDGEMIYGQVTNLTVISTWTSPVSGTVFPNNLSINTNVPEYEHLHLIPVFNNQEVGSGKNHYWEGYVNAHSGHQAGRGYLELTGYQTN